MQKKSVIFICDDDELFLDRLKKEISAWCEKEQCICQINEYLQGERMLSDIEKKAGLYMLDIDMPEMSGLELATQIKQRDSEAVILFVSNHEEMVFEAIHYAPFRFIRKERLPEELPEALLAWWCRIQQQEEQLTLATRAGVCMVAVRDILYMETRGHYLSVHCVDNVYEMRGRMLDWEEKLKDSGFLRVNAGCIVNCRYIHGLKSASVELISGEIFSISRQRRDEVKHAYMEWARRRRGWKA